MRYLPKLNFILLLAFGSLISNNANSSENNLLNRKINDIRPENLVILINQQKVNGDYLLGIYAMEIDPFKPSIRRFKLWQEWNNELKVNNESVSCSRKKPLRIQHLSEGISLNRLNPGGRITSSNKENHLVWWAACFPEQAGKNPSNLESKASSMGFPRNLLESQEILVAPKL